MNGYSDFLEMAEKRYSVRSYSDRPVEKEKMDRILRAGQVAPTAVNMQPQRVFVLQSPEALEKAKKVTRFTFGAPVILLVCSDRDKAFVMKDGQYMGTVDATIAVTHMMLEAFAEGLGTCWVRGFDRNDVIREFELPDNLVPEAMMPLGYPSDTAAPGPKHAENIPIEEMVKYL